MSIPDEVCSLCRTRQRPPANGKSSCLADPEKRDIIVHIENANRGEPTCPLKKHDDLDPLAPAPPPEPIKPIPRSEWGKLARALAYFSKHPDAGLGDTCHRIFSVQCEGGACKTVTLLAARAAAAALLASEYGVFNLEADAKAWASGEAGCGGCEGRRIHLNQKYPLTAKSCGI